MANFGNDRGALMRWLCIWLVRTGRALARSRVAALRRISSLKVCALDSIKKDPFRKSSTRRYSAGAV